MKEKTFFFIFRDKQQEEIMYDATYFLDKKILKVNICEPISEKESVRKLIDEQTGWQVFYDNATFDDILKEMRHKRHVTDFLPHEIENIIKKAEEEEGAFLEQIRDVPCLLDDADIRDKFIGIMVAARWGTERDRARKLLKTHFLPKGQKIPIPNLPELKPAMEVMKLLAKHLSKRCKDAMGEEGYEIKDTIAHNWWKDAYGILIKWAKTNEDRVCSISADDLKTLILNPSTYVNDLIERRIDVSIKTSSRRIKSIH